MVTVQITITVSGKLADLLPPPGVILHAIGGRLLEWVDDNFRAEGIERYWAPLSPTTLLIRKTGGSKMLQGLKQGFNYSVDEGEESVTVGTDNPLAKFHHYGTKPYTITVKNAKVLAAQMRKGGWIFFGKQVDHPGLPARPLLPTKRTAGKLARDAAKEVLQAYVGDQKGRIAAINKAWEVR